MVTVTSSASRLKKLVEVTKDYTAAHGGAGTFLYTDLKSFRKATTIEEVSWSDGQGRDASLW